MNGEKLGKEKGQIALQYAYGDGGRKSCWLTKNAVSELLYGVKIDAYLAMTIEGIAKATDLIGGVTLTVPEDYTDIDPSEGGNGYFKRRLGREICPHKRY